MYHNVIWAGNTSFSSYFEYKNGVLVEFDIKTVSTLLFSGDEIHIRRATDEEFLEMLDTIKGN